MTDLERAERTALEEALLPGCQTSRQAARLCDRRLAELAVELSGTYPYDVDVKKWTAQFNPGHLKSIERLAVGYWLLSNPQLPLSACAEEEIDDVPSVVARLQARAAWLRSGSPVFRPTPNLVLALKKTAPAPDIGFLPFTGIRVEFREPLRFQDLAISAVTVTLRGGVSEVAPNGELQLVAEIETQWGCGPLCVAWERPFIDGDQPEAQTFTSELAHVVRGITAFIESRAEVLVAANARAIDRDTKNGRKARGPIYDLGRTIKLDDQTRAYLESQPSGSTWTLKNRYLCPNHWRWQPIGRRLAPDEEGPRNAKRILILEHWKGPEGAAAFQHVYEVSTYGEVRP